MADLTTLGAIKTWQGGLASTNTSADALLGSLITATSADFLRAIERPDLMSNSYTENRIGDGSCRMILRHWPVTSITSVTANGVAIPAQGVNVDGWYLDTDADAERRFVLYLSGALTFPDGVRIPIRYVAGYESVPNDIAQAVTEWVVFRYNRKSSAGQTQTRTLEGENAHFEEFAIPPNTQRVIAAYKRKYAAYGTDAADAGVGGDAPPPQPARGRGAPAR
ncbi:MAG: hypothetical protein M3O02_11285 [Acidobacteriota bacterium]|nr:hypothetical protein [Acidobacteriota bacterium]